MTPLVVEATYEKGVLKLLQPLPLKEHERVRVTVEPAAVSSDEAEAVVRRSYGLIGWTGDVETLRRLALDPEFDPQESDMIFSDIPSGAMVFLDANTLVFHFAPDPVFGIACSDLLLRIKRQEIVGLTSTHVLSEMAHRLMTMEAIKLHGWPFQGIVPRLRRHPAEVTKLKGFRQAIQEVPQFGVQTLTIGADLVDQAAAISQQTGLLSNDALIVAVMQIHRLTHLASHDADFDRVPGITRYSAV